MKNLYLLPTDKPSRLYYHKPLGKSVLTNKDVVRNIEGLFNQHIYITSDEEIKTSNWCLYNKNHDSRNPNWELVKCGVIEREEMHPISEGRLLLWMTKIILTTDQDSIKDGVQAINDEFLEWFVKNPSCEKVETIKIPYFDDNGYFHLIIFPKEEPKEETPEEAAEKEYPEEGEDSTYCDLGLIQQEAFKIGAQWQAERMYSKEEVKEQLNLILTMKNSLLDTFTDKKGLITDKWFEQFKKK